MKKIFKSVQKFSSSLHINKQTYTLSGSPMLFLRDAWYILWGKYFFSDFQYIAHILEKYSNETDQLKRQAQNGVHFFYIILEF